MAGMGNPYQISSLSNCFVIGNDHDSYGGIFRTDEEQVQLMKRRGGVGHDLSHIRPKGSPVKNAALTSSGVAGFMERYSNSTREVAQDGRRGALMLSISSRHPDAEDFIDAKMETGKVTGANVSVRIDDAFMAAAMSGNPYIQQYPVDSPEPAIKRTVDAASIWKKIIHNAWRSAEPGVLFWDTVLRESVPDCYADLGYRTISTNPCGEIPLCAYDSCRLVAINLYSYVRQPFTSEASFDFELFRQHTGYAMRIMDDIIDLELEKIDRILEKIDADPEGGDIKSVERKLWQKIRKTCIEGRRTGLGITAEGDMLAALGYRYGSEEATDFSETVHRTLALAAYRSSVDMARLRGPFPLYDPIREADNPFIQRLRDADPELYRDMTRYGRRNIALLTIAPTGTTSLMSQTSSGIEPAFLIHYKRRRKINPNDQAAHATFVDEVGDHWEEYQVFHHKFITWLETRGIPASQATTMTDAELDPLIKESPYYHATANDVDWVSKVRMQGRIQKWVDHSISVTVNIPEDTSEEMVRQIYETAWEVGCKGCTIYRDGSRSGVLVSNKEKDGATAAVQFAETLPPRRPEQLEARVVRFQNSKESWIAVIGLFEGRPFEIFTGRADDTFLLPSSITKGTVIKVRDEQGEKRYDFRYKDRDGYNVTIEGLSRSFDKEYWNYAKLISGVLRHGMPIPYVVDLVESLNVPEDYINTWKNGVARALKMFIPDGVMPTNKLCGNCGDSDGLVYKEGCLTCKSCGFSECG
jgi:ribonucleoside-diphosphate reductase alpha chain